MSIIPGHRADEETAVARTAGALPFSKTIECAFACTKCGYDLFGQSLDAECPECGTPVRHGLPPDERLYIGALDDTAARRYVWRGFTLIFTFILFGEGAMVGVAYLCGGKDFVTIFAPCMAVFFVWQMWRVHRTLDREARLSRVIIGKDSVVNRSSRRKDIWIRREEVTRIEEDKTGLTIRSRVQRRYIGIPRGLGAYALARTHLAAWAPIEPNALLLQMTRIILMILLLAGGGMAMQVVQDPWPVRGCALLVLIGTGWGVWSTYYSQVISSTVRWFRMIVLCALAAWAIVRFIDSWQ